MSKIFTDSEGREWEVVDSYKGSSYKIIRPVKQEPKYTVHGPATVGGNIFDSVHKQSIEIEISVSEDQAQLIKEATSELMRVIMETTSDLNEYPPRKLLNDITLARQSMSLKGEE